MERGETVSSGVVNILSLLSRLTV